jgi:hypothetical protein
MYFSSSTRRHQIQAKGEIKPPNSDGSDIFMGYFLNRMIITLAHINRLIIIRNALDAFQVLVKKKWKYDGQWNVEPKHMPAFKERHASRYDT